MTAISAVELRKSFGSVVAVDAISLRIERGEFYGLLGPNGAGKTTFLRMVCGLIKPDSGRLTLNGVRDGSASAILGVVPQEIALYDELSGAQNLMIFGSLYGMRGEALKRRMAIVLEMVGLSDKAHAAAKTYSGGMKRRLNLAIGLIQDPEILLLDEPTVGVDPQSRARIFALLEDLHADGKTIVYTTHYMEEAERLCRRIGIIDRGRLLAEGTLAELLASLKMQRALRIYGDADWIGINLPIPVTRKPGAGYVDFIPDQAEHIGELISAVTNSGGRADRVEVITPNLEALFLQLTGKELRD